MLCLTVFSCSTESTDSPKEETPDETEQPTGDVLLKRMVEAYESETYTTTFTYDGNKLLNIKDTDGYETKITYDGDKITKVENLVDGEIAEYFTLTYDAEILSSYIHYLYDIDDEDIAYREVLTYNNDNTIDIETFSGDFTSQTTPTDGLTTYLMDGWNISKIEFEDSEDSYTHEYDDKNNLFKNVLGFQAYNFINYFSEYGFEIYGGDNNTTKITDDQGWIVSVEDFEYTYNEDNYPVSANVFYDGEPDGSIEFFYE